MDPVNIVLSGLGGQGILFMTKVLAQAALDKGFHVMGAETHGMAQRGGSVISHLRIGEVQNSLVRTGTAHFLLALEESEAYRNLPFLARGGKLYANATKSFPRPEVRAYLDKRKVFYRSLPAGEMAMAMRAPMAVNLALLGYFSAFETQPVTHEQIRATVEKVTPEGFKIVNLKVFDAGYEQGKEPGVVRDNRASGGPGPKLP